MLIILVHYGIKNIIDNRLFSTSTLHPSLLHILKNSLNKTDLQTSSTQRINE